MDNKITSFTWNVHPNHRFGSMLTFNVVELRRTEKAVQLKCCESGRSHWVPLSWFKGDVGSVDLKPWAARAMSEQGKHFVASGAYDFV